MHTKVPLIVFVFITLLSTSLNAHANRLPVHNFINVIEEISLLADEFNLSTVQKTQMRIVLLNYLPQLAAKVNTMMNNRIELLNTSLNNDLINEELLLEIASKQGQLLSDIIVTKEHLKKDLRDILTGEQKQFIDELIEIIIQYKLEHY